MRPAYLDLKKERAKEKRTIYDLEGHPLQDLNLRNCHEKTMS